MVITPVFTSRFNTKLCVLLMDCMHLCVPTVVEINSDFFLRTL